MFWEKLDLNLEDLHGRPRRARGAWRSHGTQDAAFCNHSLPIVDKLALRKPPSHNPLDDA